MIIERTIPGRGYSPAAPMTNEQRWEQARELYRVERNRNAGRYNQRAEATRAKGFKTTARPER